MMLVMMVVRMIMMTVDSWWMKIHDWWSMIADWWLRYLRILITTTIRFFEQARWRARRSAALWITTFFLTAKFCSLIHLGFIYRGVLPSDRYLKTMFDTEFSRCVRYFDRKRAAICSQASFQKNNPPSRETALDEKKWGFPRARIIFLKTCLGTYRSPVSLKIERRAKIQYRR